MSLHDKIIDIPPSRTDSQGYLIGHRDCRHAAAELAVKQDALVAALVAALEDAREWVSEHAYQNEGYEAGKAVRANLKFIDATLAAARGEAGK